MNIHFGKWRENANSFDWLPPDAPDKGNKNTKFVFCIFYLFILDLIVLNFAFLSFLYFVFLSLSSLGALISGLRCHWGGQYTHQQGQCTRETTSGGILAVYQREHVQRLNSQQSDCFRYPLYDIQQQLFTIDRGTWRSLLSEAPVNVAKLQVLLQPNPRGGAS